MKRVLSSSSMVLPCTSSIRMTGRNIATTTALLALLASALTLSTTTAFSTQQQQQRQPFQSPLLRRASTQVRHPHQRPPPHNLWNGHHRTTAAVAGTTTTVPTTTTRRRQMMTSLATTTTSITTTDTDSSSFPADYDPFAIANGIEPETQRIPESFAYYVQFVLKRWQKIRLDTQLQLLQGTIRSIRLEKQKRRRALWSKLNEQRKNIVTLAGYTSHIVLPSFTFAFLGALMASITPLWYSKCVHSVSTLTVAGSSSGIWMAVIGLGITSTLEALFTGLRGSLFWIGGSRANYNVRVKLHRSLLLQEAAFFDQNETGYLLSRLNADVTKIGAVISYHINVVFRQFAQFVFGSLVLLRLSPTLAIPSFLGIGLVAWTAAVYGDFARDIAETLQETFAKATAVAETSFSMSETIRAFDGVEIESDRFEAAQNDALELEEVQAWAYGSHKFVSDTLQAIFLGAMFIACHVFGRNGGLPAAQLTTFIFYTNFVLESSNEVGDQWARIQAAVGASASVFDLIKRVPEIRDPVVSIATGTPSTSTTATILPNDADAAQVVKEAAAPAPIMDAPTKEVHTPALTKINGDIRSLMPIISASNLTVTYGAMEKPALEGVTFDIYPGDRVAIVGRSGSGKSSLLRTMLRFYDPSYGSMSLDGVSLRQMSRSETATKISYVQQEPQLFPMSLMDNVLYGIAKDQVNAETGEMEYSEGYRVKVTEALAVAGLSVVPGNDLDLELDTRVGDGGRALSGGQRQRVAIARAVIRSPQVLLLDEPTAALDSESEKTVVLALQQAMERKTTKSMVMVTHRLGVIRGLNVNKVIVLDQGRIVEIGDPEDLLRQENSLYTGLAREQGIFAINGGVQPTRATVPSSSTRTTTEA